jgi:hypothetical protein
MEGSGPDSFSTDIRLEENDEKNQPVKPIFAPSLLLECILPVKR